MRFRILSGIRPATNGIKSRLPTASAPLVEFVVMEVFSRDKRLLQLLVVTVRSGFHTLSMSVTSAESSHSKPEASTCRMNPEIPQDIEAAITRHLPIVLDMPNGS